MCARVGAGGGMCTTYVWNVWMPLGPEEGVGSLAVQSGRLQLYFDFLEELQELDY